MLHSLRVRNIALIEDETLSFSDGLHVLTGETGAGKSLIVDSVNLVLGGRADRDLVRSGCDKAIVEAIFDAEDGAVHTLLEENGIENEGFLTLCRELTSNGRSLCRVCGTVVPLSLLRQVAACLMDVHGQHDQRFLMEEEYHLRFLDASGGEAQAALLKETAAACNAFLQCHRQYARLVRENEQKQYRMEQLEKALKELTAADLKAGEEEALREEAVKAHRVEKATAALREADQLLSGENGDGALPLAKGALQSLQRLSESDDRFQSLFSHFSSAYFDLEEAAYELSSLLSAEEDHPARTEWVEARLDQIHRLERKYGATLDDVLAKQAELQAEYDRYSSMDHTLAELARQDRLLLSAYRKSAASLTEQRHQLAGAFEQRMAEQLRDLGMEKAVFRVVFAPRGEKPPMPSPLGDDRVSFMISANPGEPLKPLNRTASGGELSRLMLALKALDSEQGSVGTMVFDEIDTGISGHMAQVVAEKLALIAQKKQVLCVTHLPQLAAMADHEFLVRKSEQDGRTHTSVMELSEEERIEELARMLGGAQGADASAREHARHMLEVAHQR